MTLLELDDIKLNQGIAYVLGLIYPLYKTGKDNNGNEFIKGCVNYNSISEEDLAEQFKIVINFLDSNGLNKLDLKSNKQSDFSISPKKGFSVLIWKKSKSDNICLEVLTTKVKEIKDSSDKEIKKAFARGCFDGRSSFDTTMHFLALDTDRVYERQDLIKSIFEDLEIDLNLNRRELNHPKNDQIRLKPKSLARFMKEVGLYSKVRKQAVEKYIETEE